MSKDNRPGAYWASSLRHTIARLDLGFMLACREEKKKNKSYLNLLYDDENQRQNANKSLEEE